MGPFPAHRILPMKGSQCPVSSSKNYVLGGMRHRGLRNSIGIIGNDAEHCENWLNAILHRKIAIVSSSSDDSLEGLHVSKEINGELLKNLKIRRHLIVTGHNQS
jgi:hypothetical protein